MESPSGGQARVTISNDATMVHLAAEGGAESIGDESSSAAGWGSIPPSLETNIDHFEERDLQVPLVQGECVENVAGGKGKEGWRRSLKETASHQVAEAVSLDLAEGIEEALEGHLGECRQAIDRSHAREEAEVALLRLRWRVQELCASALADEADNARARSIASLLEESMARSIQETEGFLLPGVEGRQGSLHLSCASRQGEDEPRSRSEGAKRIGEPTSGFTQEVSGVSDPLVAGGRGSQPVGAVSKARVEQARSTVRMLRSSKEEADLRNERAGCRPRTTLEHAYATLGRMLGLKSLVDETLRSIGEAMAASRHRCPELCSFEMELKGCLEDCTFTAIGQRNRRIRLHAFRKRQDSLKKLLAERFACVGKGEELPRDVWEPALADCLDRPGELEIALRLASASSSGRHHLVRKRVLVDAALMAQLEAHRSLLRPLADTVAAEDPDGRSVLSKGAFARTCSQIAPSADADALFSRVQSSADSALITSGQALAALNSELVAITSA